MISKEIAEKLKKLGFDGHCMLFYHPVDSMSTKKFEVLPVENPEQLFKESFVRNSNFLSISNISCIPNLHQIKKWFRDVHQIYIEVDISKYGGWEPINKVLYKGKWMYITTDKVETNTSYDEVELQAIKNAIKLIDKILVNLDKTGLDTGTLIDDIKSLRTYALEEQIPLVVKVLRLTYEHIEANNSFLIPILGDEPIDEEGVVTEADSNPVESLKYLISLIKNLSNKRNISDLKEYRDLLNAY